MEADVQCHPQLHPGFNPPQQPGDKRWVLYSKGGDRISMVCDKAYHDTIFGILFIMPGFFERWPNTKWRFNKTAKGTFRGVTDGVRTWLELLQ